jgi:hypothetical protein
LSKLKLSMSFGISEKSGGVGETRLDSTYVSCITLASAKV